MKDLYIQLSFFPETQDEKNSREIEKLKLSLDKNRKSLHAKNGKLAKEIDDINQKLDILINAICKNQKIETKQGMFL